MTTPYPYKACYCFPHSRESKKDVWIWIEWILLKKKKKKGKRNGEPSPTTTSGIAQAQRRTQDDVPSPTTLRKWKGRVWCVVYMEKGLDQSRDMQIHQSERRKNGDMFCGVPLTLGKRGKGMERERERAWHSKHTKIADNWNNFNKHDP